MRFTALNLHTGHIRMAGLVLCIAAVTGVILWRPGIFRKIRNEIIYRLPVAVPGIPLCPDCNIILVNLDTMRADEMPCYGYSRDTTPNLCAFAKKNILFSRFFTQTSFTLDSHMSIFTGLYPSTHHVVEALKDSLNPDIPTLTSVLKNNGYRAVWAGITDDINLPLDKGLERGFTEFHHIDGTQPDWPAKYKELLPLFRQDKPTFMFLHTYAPHAPYLPGTGPWKFVTKRMFPFIPVTADEFHARSLPFYRYVLSQFRQRLIGSDTAESSGRNSSIVSQLSTFVANGDLKNAEELFWTFPLYEQYYLHISWYWSLVDKGDPQMVAYIKSLYDERLHQVDSDMKALLDFVSLPEIKRKTIVIILSDNGEEIMEHGEFEHAWNIYNTEVHTPFIMAAPRVRNGVFYELVQSIDIYPTILHLVGIRPPAPLEGQSMVPVLEGRGEQQIGERYLIGQHRGDAIVSIRNNRWKMYKNNTEQKKYTELYDLMTDPQEQNNVLGKHLDIAGTLDNALENILRASPKYATVSGEFPDWVDTEKRKKLINDGYF